jgi:PBSX family phage portal protein
VNVDGTGHSFEVIEDADAAKKDGTDKPEEDQAEKAILQDFFAEPYPGKSMISIRRALRRDMEGNGWGVLEAIRNVNGDLIMLNHLESDTMRLVRLDEPVFVKKTIKRAGKEMEVRIRARERRFVQMINGKKTYFKEFGASRELNRETGEWAKPGETLPFPLRASELLYFTVNKEVRTPYGSPRWINQLPAIIGSRRAEEHNLDFFEAGGLPPVLVLVQGGYLGTDVKASLEAHLSGNGAKHRAAVVEAMSASGSLDSSGTVKVTVERFGTERQQDAMFMEYDKNCEEHVRTAFRLPPLFIGRAEDYNFATALTGYMIAEAQVFAPERVEFDERMQQVVKALGVKTMRFKSNPITLKDAENALTALNYALTAKVVTPESAIKEINKLTGMELEHQDPPDPIEQQVAGVEAQTDGKLKLLDKQHSQTKEVLNIQHTQNKAISYVQHGQKRQLTNIQHNQAKDMVDHTHEKSKETMDLQHQQAKDMAQTAQQGEKPKDKRKVAKSEAVEQVTHLVHLAEAWGSVLGLRGPCPYDPERIETVKKAVSGLQGEELHVFNELLASGTLVGVDESTEGIAQLCGTAARLMEEA